eukprot:gene26015-biopygen12981
MNSYHQEGVRDRNRAGISCRSCGIVGFDSSSIPVEHPPRDMSSSQTEHCYGGIDAVLACVWGLRFGTSRSPFFHTSR